MPRRIRSSKIRRKYNKSKMRRRNYTKKYRKVGGSPKRKSSQKRNSSLEIGLTSTTSATGLPSSSQAAAGEPSSAQEVITSMSAEILELKDEILELRDEKEKLELTCKTENDELKLRCKTEKEELELRYKTEKKELEDICDKLLEERKTKQVKLTEKAIALVEQIKQLKSENQKLNQKLKSK